MFPFASLLNGFPLFIMAVAYVIWIGVYSFDRPRETKDEVKSVRQEAFMSSPETLSGNAIYISLGDTGENCDQADAPSGINDIVVFRFIAETIRPPEEKNPATSIWLSGLYCRPPPF